MCAPHVRMSLPTPTWSKGYADEAASGFNLLTFSLHHSERIRTCRSVRQCMVTLLTFRPQTSLIHKPLKGVRGRRALHRDSAVDRTALHMCQGSDNNPRNHAPTLLTIPSATPRTQSQQINNTDGSRARANRCVDRKIVRWGTAL